MHPYLINHSDLKPERVKPLPGAFFKNAPDMTFREIAYVVINVLLGDEIGPDMTKRLVDESLSDTTPFSPEAEAAFVAALWAATQKSAAANTLLCAVEPEDIHLVNELAGKVNASLIVPKGGLHPDNKDVNLIEVQGSATDCVHLCSELEKLVPLCTLHNAAAAAVRTAVAIYCATHTSSEPDTHLTVGSAAMLRAYETAIRMGLQCKVPTLASDTPEAPRAITPEWHPQPAERHRAVRVAPTVDAIMRILQQ